MSGRYRLTEQAEEDVMEIGLTIARSQDIAAADRFLETLAARFQFAADLPGAGRTRDELLPGVRSIVEGRYLIFYRVSETDDIIVVRVLHGARDLPPLFE